MWSVISSLIISLSVTFSGAGSAFYRPSLAEYQETKEIALSLVKEYHEDTHEIISIGRSPTVLTAFLKNLKFSHISTLPLSQMNVFDQVNDIKKYNKLFSYFDSMIPTQSGKKLVFIDFSYKGKSYLTQKSLIETYLRGYHPKTKFEFVALVSEKDPHLIDQFSSKGIKTIKLNSKSVSPYGPLLWDSIYSSAYEDFAAFGKFIPWRDKTPINNPNFEEFRLLVKKEMLKDPEMFCRLIF